MTSHSNTGLTVAAGSNIALVLAVIFRANVSTISAVWDSVGANQSLTQINSQKQNTWSQYVYLFGLLNPATGNKTLSLSWTTSCNVAACLIALNGVEQGSIAAAFTNPANANAWDANPTVNITTANGDATVSAIINEGAITNGTAVPTNWFDQDASGSDSAGAYGLSTGASDTHTYTNSNTQWGIAGIRVVAAAGGASVTYPQLERFGARGMFRGMQ